MTVSSVSRAGVGTSNLSLGRRRLKAAIKAILIVADHERRKRDLASAFRAEMGEAVRRSVREESGGSSPVGSEDVPGQVDPPDSGRGTVGTEAERDQT
jgi:hypothetical protein